MKVLLITYKYIYDRHTWKKLRRADGNYSIEGPIRDVLESRGHSLDLFYMDEAILDYRLEEARKKVWEYIEATKPDLCIPVGFSEYDYGKEFLKKISTQKFTQFAYLGEDDAWSWARQGRHLAKYFNWIITYDGRAVAKYKSIGCKNIVHHQPGVDLGMFKKLEGRSKDIDVSFVGVWNNPRQKLIDYLRAAGINIYVRGLGWPDGVVKDQDDLNDIINRSKIVLSLNTPAFYVGWRPLVSLIFRRAGIGETGSRIKFDGWNFWGNLRLWLDKRNAQVKSRHFEPSACGTFQLTEDADDLREYFKLGEEIVVYKDNEDLVEKIKYYLAHDKEREEIARRGYERTIREHSTQKRFEEIFRMMGFKI